MKLSQFILEQRANIQAVIDAGRDERTGIANPAEVQAAEFYNKTLDLLAQYTPERDVCPVFAAILDGALSDLTAFVDNSHPSRNVN